MSLRPLLLLVLCLSVLVVTGCSGGGDVAGIRQPGCASGGAGSETLCLVSCNLGCTQIGCSINQIAQNQPIILNFNQDIDPLSVSSSSISFRTSTGEEPVGRFLVIGDRVEFIPEVQIIGAASFFGFTSGQTYILTLPGGPNELNALRATSGDPLSTPYVCNLAVTKGIVDLDQQPPVATLVSPSQSINVDPKTPIVLEFSELISVAPFIGTTALTSPIKVRVRKTRPLPGGGVECDPNFSPLQIPGDWQLSNNAILQKTTTVFSPQQSIPSSVCVQVEVTNQVRDLSGKPSQGQNFLYRTTVSVQPTASIVEDFSNDLNLDRAFSSGSWSNGSARPGVLGGDGLHGDFDPKYGLSQGGGVFLWDTDNTVIPRTATLSGETETVTDGVFYFSRFIVQRGVRVIFRGSKPVRILVRGDARIEGDIELDGESRPAPDGNAKTGQQGGRGGAGGAPGGDGADQCDGLGARPSFFGKDGTDAPVPQTHPYAAQAVGTAGSGSSLFPVDGLNNSVLMGWMGIFSVQIAAGGGGAGFGIPGAKGEVLATYQMQTQYMGPDAPGGTMFSLDPLPAGASVLDHYLVGGASGGGAGSHPFLSPSSGKMWRSGGAGGGGGGAFGLRVGRDFGMGPVSSLTARGGTTSNTNSNFNYGVPGGGGAGGVVVMQVDGATSLRAGGTIDVSGGIGGTLDGATFGMTTKGGDGSHGYVRMEVAQPPSLSLLGKVVPDPSSVSTIGVFPLAETDLQTGSRSLWFLLPLVFAPDFLRYEIEATVDGNQVKFTDDPNATGVPAVGSQAVNFYVQGAELDATGQVNVNKIKPWRRYVGPFGPASSEEELDKSLDDDNALAVRFLLIFNKTSPAQQVSIEKVNIVYRPF